MLLEELIDYKNQLMKDILTNEKIVSLINDDIDFEDAKSLAYTQVFPFEFIPETVDMGKTFICFDVDVQRPLMELKKLMYAPLIRIWVFTHKTQLRLPGGGVRVDNLCCELAKVLNGSRFYGLGELQLYSVSRFAPITDFQGKALTFTAKDLNVPYEPSRKTPVNRKNPDYL